jgi:hypothetical protein
MGAAMSELERITAEMPKRFAVAELVGYCEGLCASGILGKDELTLRTLVARTLAAFDMPSKAEIEASRSAALAAPANDVLEPPPGEGAYS